MPKRLDAGLTDVVLRQAIREFEAGLKGNALGSSLYKKRIAVGSKGKRGGLRTIIAFRDGTSRVFCLHLFAKNERDNITKEELAALKRIAIQLLGMDNTQITEALRKKVIEEVDDDEGNEKADGT